MALPLCLIVHVALPAGASDAHAEAVWSRCLQPLVGAIHHTPEVKLGLVLGGELIEDLQQRHPEGLQWVRNLVRREQIELLGAPLHDPVLTAIPERDAVGQYVAHARLLVASFGVRPTGAWLPHAVWDPVVPRILGDAGFRFLAVGDRVLGPRAAEPCGVWYTERDGRRLALLPTDGSFDSAIPDHSVKAVLGRIQRKAQTNPAVILAVDGVRFGLRDGPDGDRDRAWFATFLGALGRAGGAVEPRLPTAMVASLPNRGARYLAGPSEPWEQQILGHPEATWLHRRMLRVSRMVERLDRAVHGGTPAERRPDPSQLEQAHRYLYRAQSAHTYTHGPHAGIYDARDRARVWRDLIRAERVVLEAMRAHQRTIGEIVDLDLDGVDEIALLSPAATVAIDPAVGGGAIECSVLTLARNLLDVPTRRPEPYHGPFEKPEDPTSHEVTARGETSRTLPAAAGGPPGLSAELRQEIQYDATLRRAFLLRFLGPDDTVADLAAGLGQDLAPGLTGPWATGDVDRHGEEGVDATLTWEGALQFLSGAPSVRIVRRYRLHRDPHLECRFDLTNRSGSVIRGRLAVLIHLGVTAERDVRLSLDHQRIPLEVPADAGSGQTLRVEGPDVRVELTAATRATFWTWPIRTVHLDRGAPVLSHQGTAVAMIWPLEVWDKEKARIRVDLTAFSP